MLKYDFSKVALHTFSQKHLRVAASVTCMGRSETYFILQSIKRPDPGNERTCMTLICRNRQTKIDVQEKENQISLEKV